MFLRHVRKQNGKGCRHPLSAGMELREQPLFLPLAFPCPDGPHFPGHRGWGRRHLDTVAHGGAGALCMQAELCSPRAATWGLWGKGQGEAHWCRWDRLRETPGTLCCRACTWTKVSSSTGIQRNYKGLKIRVCMLSWGELLTTKYKKTKTPNSTTKGQTT